MKPYLNYTGLWKERLGIAYLDPAPDRQRVIVLLHGLGADAESWVFQYPVLIAAGFRPLAPDLPGFGRSAAYAQRWSVKRTAEKLAAWLAALGVERFSLVGHSMGGAVAQELALICAERVEKLVLVNTFAHLRIRFSGETRYLTRRFVTLNFRGLDQQAAQVAERVFPREDQTIWRDLVVEKILQASPRVYRQAMLSLAVFDARRKAKKLSMPALVVTSEEDTTIAPSIQTELASRLPNARQVRIEQSGHAVLIDQAEEFNRTLLTFLRER